MADSIYSKFVAARGAVKNPPLDSTNPHFKNRYASLAATLDEVNAACARNGIAYVQTLRESEDGYNLESFVVDGEGSRIELSQFPVANVPNPQNFGSEMTYKKRQQAQADWGIVGDEDDDGEGAAKPYRAEPKRRQAEPKADRLGEVRGLYAAATKAGIRAEGIEGWLSANFGVATAEIGKLTDQQLFAFCEYLRAVARDAESLRAASAEMVA